MLALSLSPGVKSSKITALAVEERPPSLVLKVKGLPQEKEMKFQLRPLGTAEDVQ